MATALMLPDGLAPSNLHLRSTVKTRFVENDVYDICRRLAEVSTRLFVVELEEDNKAAWMVMEMCADGVARTVKKYDELDGRMLHDVARMLQIPFEVRIQMAQDEIDAANARRDEEMLDKLYDNMGGEMLRELERCNFVQRPVSYPKLGVAAPRRTRARTS